MADNSLTDRTVVISGGSRGIGLAIGIAAARRGANVVLLAKTDTPHPRLPGTVHTAAADVEAAGGRRSRWSGTCAAKRTCGARSRPRCSGSAASTCA
ncbi:hypothetical protein JPH1_10720 [Mycobacterium avium subsp. hominissuis]|uniref:Short chain dehydrogenase family protein n=1 Tax=Mycobacterium avium subsp. hominissuis TaxID=439334 RepID=A0AAI8SJW3_MYCAV|nr:hypothetical protein JPH1_10720 [Mycobacterium avium subsp. hominissuis]